MGGNCSYERGLMRDRCFWFVRSWFVRRFVSSMLFAAAVALLACTIFTKQDTKSTPTAPSIDKINKRLCKAKLGGGPDCRDDDSAEGVTCPTGQVPNEDGSACVESCSNGQEINGVCCSNDRITNGGTTCCPNEQKLTNNNKKCCQPNEILNEDGSACVCPTGIPTTTGKCCPPGKVADKDGSACVNAPAVVCPQAGQVFNGTKCVCRSETSEDEKGECCPNERFITTNSKCCPKDSKKDNSKCECENQTMTYDPATNTCKSKTNTSKLQHTTALWVLLAIIGAICIFLLVLFFTRSNDKAVQGVVGPHGREKEAVSDGGNGEYEFGQGQREEDY